jgi:hypothetical protein
MMIITYLALAASIYFLIRYFKTNSEYSSWKKRELITGEIGEETRRIPANGGTKYIYHFKLNTTPDETMTTYEDFVRGNEKPTLKVGDKVEVYYDPVIKYFRDKKKLQKEPKKHLLWFIICFGVAFFVAALNVILGMIS